MEILIVEDDRRMANLLERGLRAEGHQVHVARHGGEGVEFAELHSYDVIVLDVLMPVLNGFDVTERLRNRGDQTPILILTARDAPRDAARGLDAGADDYLTKPFDFEELLARIRAVSRRGPIERPAVLEVADLRLDPASREVSRAAEPIELTRREFQVLELLMRRTGRVVPRTSLLDTVWGDESEVGFNTVDAFVSSLRRKLESGGASRLIHTVRGVGFCLRDHAGPEA